MPAAVIQILIDISTAQEVFPGRRSLTPPHYRVGLWENEPHDCKYRTLIWIGDNSPWARPCLLRFTWHLIREPCHIKPSLKSIIAKGLCIFVDSELKKSVFWSAFSSLENLIVSRFQKVKLLSLNICQSQFLSTNNVSGNIFTNRAWREGKQYFQMMKKKWWLTAISNQTHHADWNRFLSRKFLQQ
jgi:hypothetical protein